MDRPLDWGMKMFHQIFDEVTIRSAFPKSWNQLGKITGFTAQIELCCQNAVPSRTAGT
jgi:hypothetical protein